MSWARLRSTAVTLLLGATVLTASGCEESTPQATPVVLIVIDTLRADHLGCYGYEHDTSPVLDAFAAHSTLFEANSSQCNATFPSITSILTGLYPRTHGNYLAVPLEHLTVAPRDHDTLAGRLRAEGYDTLAVVSHPLWTEGGGDTALRSGWDAFSTIPTRYEGAARREQDHAGYTNVRAFELLERYDEQRDGPLCLWVHYFDPHAAYRPPPAYGDPMLEAHRRAGQLDGEDSFAERRALYDGEIAYCDAEIGRMFERLRELDLFDCALIVVVADHGENLGERHPGSEPLAFHHGRLFEAVVHVPLIVKLPFQTEGRRVSALTQSIDVLPTVVDLLGLPAGAQVDGRSLVPLLDGSLEEIHDLVFMESSDHVEKAVRGPRSKYLEEPGSGTPRLFDWRADPGELHDRVADVSPDIVAGFADALRAFRPKSRLLVELTPDEGAYDLELQLGAGSPIVEGARVSAGELALGPAEVSWRVHVDREPVRLEVDLAERGGALRAMARRSDGRRPAVHLGQLPVEWTPAVPHFRPALPAPGGRFAFTRRGAKELAVSVELTADESARFEVRCSERYGQLVRRWEAVGWSPLERVQGPEANVGSLRVATGAGPGLLTAQLALAPQSGDVQHVLRVNGCWPKLEDVRVDGYAIDASIAEFTFDAMADGRLATALLSGPPTAPAAGALLMWIDGAQAPLAIDQGRLEPELVEELRKLGYAR